MAALHVRDVPDEVYDRLKAMAARERRSLNAQVVELLHRAVESDELRNTRLEALERITARREALAATGVQFDSLADLREDRAR